MTCLRVRNIIDEASGLEQRKQNLGQSYINIMQSIIGHLGKKYSFQTVFTVANRTKGTFMNLHELVPGKYYEALQNLQSAQVSPQFLSNTL
jgi:hypothetical protein